MTSSTLRPLWILFLGLTLGGCSQAPSGAVPTFPVKGQVTYRGVPAAGAFVTLHPKVAAPDVPTPRASVARDGSLELTTFNGGDGAPEGEYVVTVQWYKPVRQAGDLVAGPNVIPAKYASPKTSPLVIKVAANDNVLPPIQL